MIQPTDSLRSDLPLIRRGVSILAAIAASVRIGSGFPAEDCAQVLRFVREFVAGTHLRKASAVILPRVAMYGDAATSQSAGEALRLHDQFVELSHSLVLFWEPADDLTREERVGFADTADAIVARWRRLERMESTVLWQAFDRAVPADEKLDCASECEAIDAARIGAEKWKRHLDPVAARWLP